MIDFDVVLQHIGGLGRYQYITAIIIGYYGVIMSNYSLASIFLSVEPDYRCDIDQTDKFGKSLYSEAYTLNNKGHVDHCHVKTRFCKERNCSSFTSESSNPDDPLLLKCTDIVFDNSTWTQTTVTEFDLICDNAHEAALPDLLYMSGMAMSMVTMGGVSDMYGRQKTLFWCQTALVVFSFCQLFTKNVIGFGTVRFFLGFFVASGYTAAFIYLTEIVESEKRAKLGLSVNALFGLGSIFYTLGGYLFRNWRHLVMWVSVQSVIICAGLYRLHESPRWLISRNHTSEAFDVATKIAATNKRSLSADQYQEADSKVQPKRLKHVTLMTLFKSRVMAKMTFVQCYMWAAIAMGYYGISLGVNNLAGNVFVNNIIMGLMEVSAVVVVMFSLDNVSRHKITMLTFLLSGIALLISGLLSIYGESGSAAIASTIFYSLGKFFTSACYSTIYVFTAELYPTSCRNTGFSCCNLASRVATIVVPMIIQVGHDSAPWLPPILFGSSCIIAAALTIILPDTFGVPLMETLDEAEKFYSNPLLRHDQTLKP